ncbi:xanthine dehydrogenase family protein molybdopterin-binding subunit [Rhizobium sp. B230/85]|uniref:xanthine dehydrogenase family protein molybdopterin-binding subunit n=1 Tax=unclassified Rhizobium TaxID=2613769 RepID=UPI001ADB7861|nr:MULTISPECIES: xanthine dehydrogenase family protein molybdopterin-binding subunit [unclassified Rhizobium]MBO9135229.1 xanthine dehydrogenase family protein molybdopterin-binding subunit [Rhizobium sp. B209b/85]QXZ98958.1 xanthine dehydrogenase family protein molybdopterin-binding subunit [Rhizobium sp. B230/85]
MTIMEPRKHGDASDGMIGGRHSRFEGTVKVTGAATYALEYPFENLAHAALLQSTIPAGRVLAVDTAQAKAMPGVLLVLTPEDDFGLKVASDWYGNRPENQNYNPLPRQVRFNGETICAVVAETQEQATEAVKLIRVTYEETPAVMGLDDPNAGQGKVMDNLTSKWGDAEKAFASAQVKIDVEYRTPREFHVAMEPHGLTAKWDGDTLTVWEPSQWAQGMARSYAEWFGLPLEDVRIISPFIGGGFGSKGAALAYGAVAAVAARKLGRPVKLAVTRPQNFTSYGGRAATRQQISLGATSDGLLQAIIHRGASETSVYVDYPEQTGAATAVLYKVANFSSEHRVVPVNTVTPGALRGPGKNPSAYGIECAVEELAYEIDMDPLELRLKNYADHDYQSGKPWSTRRLREALTEGADAFGWSGRSHQPRSMREGRTLVGWGIGCGTFPVIRAPSSAMIRILGNGRVEVISSAIDMGQGTYTILAQTASEALGVPVSQIDVLLGDSRMPGSAIAGGSMLAGSITGAVHKAAIAARDELIELALNDANSPLRDTGANTLTLINGRLGSARGGEYTLSELMLALGKEHLEVLRNTLDDAAQSAADHKRAWTTMAGVQGPTMGDHSMHSWCAHFVEVKIDEDFGTVRVSRIVSAFDCGRLYNPRLVESQWRGGIIMGIGQALLEEGLVDRRNGRLVNNNVADYLVPTNSDVPDIQVISVGVPDLDASALGGKGVGEVGIVGVAPAIANAVFHATGKRVRDLPITLEKLL